MSRAERVALAGVKPGDVLFYRNVNEERRHQRGEDGLPPTVLITKVGPKRVAYEQHGRPVYASIESGRIDDWSWLQRREAYHENVARDGMWATLKALGLGPVGYGDNDIPTEKLAKIVLLLEGIES